MMKKQVNFKKTPLEQKRDAIKQNIHKMKQNLTRVRANLGDTTQLTELSLSELQRRIRDRSVTPLDILHAFQSKVVELYEKGNAGICEFILEAEQQANQLKDVNVNISDLYGIPVSIKELCGVSGYDVTFGLLKFCHQPENEDCVLVQVLKEAGAIPFVLTATSQMALCTSGINPLFGDMRNPYSKNHEPGGSSSGEGVLLAQNGSPIGFGSDLAGSIRIPCAFCGLAGLKPTAQRISARGSKYCFDDATVGLKVCVGPMGKFVDDLAKSMRTLLCPSMFRLDPNIPVMPFDDSVYTGKDKCKLTVGYYDTVNDPNLIQTVPSVRRALKQALDILQSRGYTVVMFNPPEPQKALSLGLRALTVDGGQALRKVLDGEPLNEEIKGLKQLVSIPDFLRPVVDTAARSFVGKPAAMAQYVKKMSGVSELMHLINQIETYRTQFFKAWFAAGGLDVVVCPVWSFPAYEVGTPIHFVSPSLIYTMLYNLLDYPAGVVPMGKVNNDDIENSKLLEEEYKKSGDEYNQKLMQQQLSSKGLPLSVQVVGKPYREELVLRVMRELEEGQQMAE
ncbi:Fatty-acid amide hydrolase [Paragonimus heterotremus]|uniref:Fatty-acid amide hydrolase n=1 Tax=Paragonimus heterotremus TaxID=100268 RepID=A0A8J4T2V5_9TREM|nr:Fatty-acid amide hydrolase [Paragonimus heterotremus]